MIALGINLVKLTKPKIMLLVLAAGISALFADGSMLTSPGKIILFLSGLFLTGGCANALNQYFERTIDSEMSRTSGKRPLPLGRVTPEQALIFSILIGVGGVVLLASAFNILTGALALMTILFYSLLYTLWLKPRTPQNIVIGGIAGAMAPVGAWTAATGSMAPMPWLMFLLIFLWTPAHFWSLALCFKDDYIKANLPMMPVVRGEKTTLNLIFYYTVMTVLISFAPLLIEFSRIYLAIASFFGAVFIYKTFLARSKKSRIYYWRLFKYSIIYLFVMLAGIAFAGKF